MAVNRYRFGEFELDGDRYELSRAGERVAVEPRVLDLLALLVREHGRMVPKDELVAAVWSDESASDAALSRAVHHARRALGDSASAPRWIETVHGRGYRFTGEVAGVDEAPAAPVASRRSLAARHRPTPRTTSRTTATVAAAVGGLALLLVLGLAWRRADQASSQPPPAARSADRIGPRAPLPTMALHGFAAPRGELETQLLGLSLVDLLASRLRSVEGLTMRDAAAARAELDDPAAFGNRLGARYVLSGELATGGEPSARLTVTLYEVVNGRRAVGTPLGHFALPPLESSGGLEQHLRLRDRIVERVVELVLPALGGASLDDTLAPRDPVAYRYYLLGYSRLLDDFCAGGAAEAMLERSVDLDPRFAPAWLYLGVSRYNQVWACGGDAAGYAVALAAFDRAAEIAPDYLLPRTNRIALLVETGRVEEAWEAILVERRHRPDAPSLLNAELYALRYAGYLEASLARLEKLLRLDPLAFAKGAIGGSPATYLYLGRWDDFLAQLPPLEMPYFAYFRGFVALLQGDRAGARSAVAPALGASPGGVFGQLCHVVAALAEGDRATARAVVESVSRHRRELGHLDGEITYKQAQLLALAGAPGRAVEELGRTVDDGFFCPQCFETDAALASLAGRPDYEEVLMRARRRHIEFGERYGIGGRGP